MADPINLNKIRKAKARTEAVRTAVENRAKHGRTKADKALEAAKADKVVRLLDQSKRER